MRSEIFLLTTWIELIADGKIWRIGAIAQLGERVNGIHEVGSSILPGSTTITKADQGLVNGS